MIECESAVRAYIRRRCKFGFPPFCVSEAQNCLISAIFWPFQSKRSSKILANQCASRDHKVAEIQRHLLGASDIIAALPLVAINDDPTERRRRKFQHTTKLTGTEAMKDRMLLFFIRLLWLLYDLLPLPWQPILSPHFAGG